MRKPPNAADTSARSLSSTASSSDELAWSAYPLDIDTEYYCAVGEISHRWSWIERQCGVIGRETLGITKHAGWAVMSGVSVRVSGTILEALGAGDYLNKYPALKARVEVLGKRLGNIGEMRNQYAHAYWGYESPENAALGVWRFKSAEERVTPVWTKKNLAEIKNDCKSLRGLQCEMQSLTRDLKDALRGR